MNKELNTQIEQIMADFNKRQEETLNEIENLKKSTDVIKESFIREYKIVEKAIVEDMKDVYEIVKTLSDDEKYWTGSDWSLLVPMFSVFRSDEYTFRHTISFDTYQNAMNFCLEVQPRNSYSCNDSKYMYFWVTENNTLERKSKYGTYPSDDNFYNEFVIKYYKSGYFKEDVIESIQRMINNKLERSNKILESHKRILENAEPISNESKDYWSDYIMYLLKWSSEHADKSFSGMSPACYDEWLDNEEEE